MGSPSNAISSYFSGKMKAHIKKANGVYMVEFL
jgi:hypothetical protein